MEYTELKGCHPGGDPKGLKGPDGMNTLSSYQSGMDDMVTIIKDKIGRLMDEYKPTVGGIDEITGAHIALAKLLSFLSDLKKEEKPMNPDDAMKVLEEKIALVKQRGTWDEVDVDKYMDEVRGREPEKPMNQEGLEEEIERYLPKIPENPYNEELRVFARHFAQWGAEHLKK